MAQIDTDVKTCPTCSGSGELTTSHRFTCYTCDGSGKVPLDKYKRALADEQALQRNLDRSVSAMEYRYMGG